MVYISDRGGLGVIIIIMARHEVLKTGTPAGSSYSKTHCPLFDSSLPTDVLCTSSSTSTSMTACQSHTTP